MHDGTVEATADGYALKFRRDIPHDADRVWNAITDPGVLRNWLGEVELDLRIGGRYRLAWLNATAPEERPVLIGEIAKLDPPRLLEVRYTYWAFEAGEAAWLQDPHPTNAGRLRWQIETATSGCVLTFTNVLDEFPQFCPMSLAGWHIHLEFLDAALTGEKPDWQNFPMDRWQQHYERYEARYPEGTTFT